MTVVFDAWQNSETTFAVPAGTDLYYVGSPATDCRALPVSSRIVVNEDRFGRLTA